MHKNLHRKTAASGKLFYVQKNSGLITMDVVKNVCLKRQEMSPYQTVLMVIQSTEEAVAVFLHWSLCVKG